MSDLEKTAKGLAVFFAKLWGCEVGIVDSQLASAGAHRSNLLFAAQRGDETLELVATIVPNPAVQVMDVEVEAATLRFAKAAGMPVPHVHAVCSDPAFVGGPFFVAGRIDGETIPRRVLRLVAADPALGPRLGHQCGRALACLHSVDPGEAPSELPRPRKGSPVDECLTRVERSIARLLQPSPAFRLGLRWLERNRPPDGDSCVLHGDFRNGNLMVDPEGLRAALDWEACRIGDPMEDLAWLCTRMWRFRNDDREVGGFARRESLREGYESAGGEWNADRFHWWKVASTLNWGLLLARQAAAHIDGSVPSIVMAASGRRVAELEYDTLMLIRPGSV